MAGRLEYWKERVTVASVMVGYAGSTAGVLIGLLVGLALGILAVVRSLDLATVLLALVGVLASALAVSLLLGVFGLATGGVGGLLQLTLRRKMLGIPASLLAGGALGWAAWQGVREAVLAWGTALMTEVAAIPAVETTGQIVMSVLGMVGGLLGALQVVAFVEVMDRPRKMPPPPGAERQKEATPPPGPLPEAERGRQTEE